MNALIRLIVAAVFFGLAVRALRWLGSLAQRRDSRRVGSARSSGSDRTSRPKSDLKVSPGEVIDVPYDDVP